VRWMSSLLRSPVRTAVIAIAPNPIPFNRVYVHLVFWLLAEDIPFRRSGRKKCSLLDVRTGALDAAGELEARRPELPERTTCSDMGFSNFPIIHDRNVTSAPLVRDGQGPVNNSLCWSGPSAVSF
jgi:hypothetical protein